MAPVAAPNAGEPTRRTIIRYPSFRVIITATWEPLLHRKFCGGRNCLSGDEIVHPNRDLITTWAELVQRETSFQSHLPANIAHFLGRCGEVYHRFACNRINYFMPHPGGRLVGLAVETGLLPHIYARLL